MLAVGGLLGAAGAARGAAAGGFVVGAAIGGAIGYFLGSLKANGLRLEAQLALCQVAIEKNTRSGAQGVRASA